MIGRRNVVGAAVAAALLATGSAVPARDRSPSAPARLGWVILYVPDVEATLAFYERAFGLERRYLHGSRQYGELSTGATVLAFIAERLAAASGIPFRPNRPEDPPYGGGITLVSDDVASPYKRAVDTGASALKAPEKKPWGQTVGYLRDLNGVLVEIASPVER